MRSKTAPVLALIVLGSLSAALVTALSGKESQTVTLTVNVLPTSDEVNGTGLHADRYPKTVRVESTAGFADRIAAYGAAYRVWIAPKGWIGSSTVAFDGRTAVNLYPPDGSAKSGPRFLYEDSGGCAGCALTGAAPYFPKAMEDLKKSFGTDTVETLPHDTKLVSVSPSLVMYSLPGRDGLLGSGAAYFLPPNEYFFARAEFFLPDIDAKLLKVLVDAAVSQQKWK